MSLRRVGKNVVALKDLIQIFLTLRFRQKLKNFQWIYIPFLQLIALFL